MPFILFEFEKGQIPKDVLKELVDGVTKTLESNTDTITYFPTFETPNSFFTQRGVSSRGFSLYNSSSFQHLNYRMYLSVNEEIKPFSYVHENCSLKEIGGVLYYPHPILIGSEFLINEKHFYLQKDSTDCIYDENYIFISKIKHLIVRGFKKIIY